MFKNVAGQTVEFFVFDYTTGAPKTGDAANLTKYLSKDDGTLTALTDTSAAEISSTNAPGWYRCDVSQTESNANKLLFTGKSSTSNVAVVGRVIYTRPQYAADMVISSGGVVSGNVTQFGGAAGTFASGRPEVNTTHAAGTAWGSGAITAASIASNALTAAKLDPDVTTELQSGLATAAALATVDGIVDNLVSGLIFGAAATGTLSTTVATTNLTGYANDQLIGRVVIWLSGNAEGEASTITDYASTNGTLTFDALTTAPGNGDTFKIV